MPSLTTATFSVYTQELPPRLVGPEVHSGALVVLLPLCTGFHNKKGGHSRKGHHTQRPWRTHRDSVMGKRCVAKVYGNGRNVHMVGECVCMCVCMCGSQQCKGWESDGNRRAGEVCHECVCVSLCVCSVAVCVNMEISSVNSVHVVWNVHTVGLLWADCDVYVCV